MLYLVPEKYTKRQRTILTVTHKSPGFFFVVVVVISWSVVVVIKFLIRWNPDFTFFDRLMTKTRKAGKC